MIPLKFSDYTRYERLGPERTEEYKSISTLVTRTDLPVQYILLCLTFPLVLDLTLFLSLCRRVEVWTSLRYYPLVPSPLGLDY